MLSYRHAFHAGNHADILKHSLLVNILESLNKKEKPYTVFDTHAGSGIYSLTGDCALKTQEAEHGIISLLKSQGHENAPESLLEYIAVAKAYSARGLYPGSVEFEKIFMDSSCRHIVSELNNSEIDVLKKNAKAEPLLLLNKNQTRVKTQVSHRDGLELILALSPPEIKRGLCVIDPSYEEKNEYGAVADTVIQLHKKWSAGIIFLWYPLILHRSDEIEKMKSDILQSVKNQNQNTALLKAEFLVNKKDSHTETDLKNSSGFPRLYGSGIFVINAPWQLDEKAKDSLLYIASRIYQESRPSFDVTLY